MRAVCLRLLEIPITVGRDDARREATDELGKNKYGNAVPDAIDRFLRWLMRQVKHLLDMLFGVNSIATGTTGWAAVALIVAVVIAVLGVLVWRFGLPKFSPRVPDAAVDTDPEREPEDYRSAAERAAADGDYRTAVKESFRAMVRELEVRTIIEPRASRTAFETAALAARALPTQDGPLYQAAMTFNEVIYSRRAATAEDYARVQAAEHSVVAAADEGYVEVPA